MEKKKFELPPKLVEWLQDQRTDPVVFAENLLGMPLHEGQKKYLRRVALKQDRIYVLTCANRWGKSVLVSILQLWYLFNKFGIDNQDTDAWEAAEYRTANIAPHSALTEPVFKTIHQIMTSSFGIRKSGKLAVNNCIIGWLYLPDKTLNTPPYKQFFHNNSYIEHRSLGADQGDSLQGKPYGLVTYDEGGRSDHLQNEIDDAIKPRLFDWGASLHILSTPSQESKSTLAFYKLYQDGLVGLNQTYTQTGSIRENSFFNKEEIQAQYDFNADNPLKDQVLEGKFIFGGSTLFPWEDILESQDKKLNDGIRKIEGHSYIIGVDTAVGKDEMAYMVIDVTEKPYRLVRILACKGNSKSPQMHLNDFIDLCEAYYDGGNLKIMLETWNGESVRFYSDLPPWIQILTQCYGAWQPTKLHTDNDNPMKARPNNAKKPDILLALRKLLAAKELKLPEDQKLTQQLQIYREDDKGLPTDRLMALALACFGAQTLAPTEILWQPIDWWYAGSMVIQDLKCKICKSDKDLIKIDRRKTLKGVVQRYICNSCNTVRLKRYRATKIGAERTYAATKGSIYRNYDKQKARMVIYRALKAGSVTKSECCDSCGQRLELQGHHYDYSRPLIVAWLCVKCHSFLHRSRIWYAYLKRK